MNCSTPHIAVGLCIGLGLTSRMAGLDLGLMT